MNGGMAAFISNVGRAIVVSSRNAVHVLSEVFNSPARPGQLPGGKDAERKFVLTIDDSLDLLFKPNCFGYLNVKLDSIELVLESALGEVMLSVVLYVPRNRRRYSYLSKSIRPDSREAIKFDSISGSEGVFESRRARNIRNAMRSKRWERMDERQN